MFSDFPCGIKISLTERRSSAAAAIFHKLDVKSERFEHFHRGNSDVRLVVTHKGVVPEDDIAAFL